MNNISQVNLNTIGLFDMEFFKINPNHLDESEVNYELAVRNFSINGSIISRRRDLRVVFRDPESEKYVRLTDAMMIEDIRVVPMKLKEIADLLSQGPNPTCFSRLVHYYQRIRRYCPRTAQQQEELRCLLELISKISANYFSTGIDEQLGGAPVAESTTQVNASNEDVTVGQRNLTVNQAILSANTAGTAANTVNVQQQPGSPWLMTWDDTEGAVGGNIQQSERDMSNVIPALVENLLNFRHGNQSMGAIPRQVETTNVLQSNPGNFPAPSLLPEPIQQINASANIQEGNAGGSADLRDPREYGGPASQPANVSAVEDSRANRPPFVEFAPNPPSGRVRVSNENREFNHVSEIESYIKKYLDQMALQGSLNPPVSNQTVNNLSNQMANFSIHPGVNMSRLRQPAQTDVGPSGISLQNRPMPDPSPPLQLSGHASGLRNTLDFGTATGNPQHGIFDDRSRNRTGFPIHHDPAATIGNSSGIQRNSFQVPMSGYSRRLPHQQCSIIEKWPKFTGDSNAVPVTDFLRQISILCRSYDITKNELRMHAHLLFKDSAYVWFTTYEEKFTSWEVLEAYLKMRYDNPNRDRIIREEMRARKQRPTELFSAYLTDMEMLAQRMIKKMSEAEKFEIIVENMKLTYKRRLALEPIHSIEHLAQLCFKFDALESNLYTCSAPPRPTIHQVECEDDNAEDPITSDDLEEIYALKAKIGKSFGRPKPNLDNSGEKPKQVLCWNCQRVGHLRKDCDKRKTIFCHICGLTDTTAYRCPNKHDLGQKEELPKNE